MGSYSRSQLRTLANADANRRECRANCRHHNSLCNINDLLAVGTVWREPLSKEISLLLGEKYKMERNNRRRGQVFPSFPGFTRSGQVIWVSEEQAENRRLTGDERARNRSVS